MGGAQAGKNTRTLRDHTDFIFSRALPPVDGPRTVSRSDGLTPQEGLSADAAWLPSFPLPYERRVLFRCTASKRSPPTYRSVAHGQTWHQCNKFIVCEGACLLRPSACKVCVAHAR